MNQLSTREKEILALIAKGHKQKEIADKLSISKHTVKNTIYNIANKLGVRGAVNLAIYAKDNSITA